MNRLEEMKPGAIVRHMDGREGKIDTVTGDWVLVAFDRGGPLEAVLMGFLDVIEPAPEQGRAA
ncbi:MAG: hypothetical protein E6Q98_15900 [Rhodospirillaceae bacterium]|nr:MAG: hypothetical protein E6Q98_15900 [Rhodospirillaceae bacterium]